MFKFVVLFCVVSSACAGLLQSYVAQPTIIQEAAPSSYNFNYDINDGLTGDSKSQRETSNNGAVAGSYELNDADGFRRIVDYTADDVHGFRANVRREPLAVAYQPTLVKKVFAAPAQTHFVRSYQAAPAQYVQSYPAAAYPW